MQHFNISCIVVNHKHGVRKTWPDKKNQVDFCAVQHYFINRWLPTGEQPWNGSKKPFMHGGMMSPWIAMSATWKVPSTAQISKIDSWI
jgi:hypothetical protein